MLSQDVLDEQFAGLSRADKKRVMSVKRKLLSLAKRAAKLRDEFREVEGEAAQLAESFDPEANGLADALRALGATTDEMSGLV